MEKKIAVLGFGVVAALVVSVLGFFNGDTTIVNPVEIRQVPVDISTGANASSFFTENDYGVGGVHKLAKRVALNGTAASTTVCAIPAPTGATSTLTFFSYAANSATGTQMDLIAYKSASPWLATTALTDRALLAANTNERVIGTTTAMDTLFTSGDYVVVRSTVAAGGAGATSPTSGACQVEFTKL